MRTVSDLNEITECPRCGSSAFALYIHEDPSITDYKKCFTCGEKIYTNKRTYSAEEQRTVCCGKKTIEARQDRLNQKRKEKENFIFEMREEISALDWCSHDSKTQTLVENIQNILNRIIDYIEEN